MNDHLPPPPPPRRLILHRSAIGILKQTTSIFSTGRHLLMFLLLSFILLSLRVNVETATHALTSFIDKDPSIKSLLARIQLPPNPTSTITTRHRHRHRRRYRPFLQLTRVGTLDDDFFSGDEELDHRFFGSHPKPQLNATSFILDSFDPQLGFSNFVSDNGIRVSETVRSGAKLTFRSIDKEERVLIDQLIEAIKESDETDESKTDLQFFLKRFGLEHHDFSSSFLLVVALSSLYGLVILDIVVTHAWVHGIVFVLIINHFCNRYESFIKTIWNGACKGLLRLSGFIILKWVIRDALTQLLGVWFFGEINDQYSLFKIFVRVKFMPFSLASPWVKGFDREIYGFMLSYFLIDMLMSFVFAVDAWIVMADSRKTGKEVVKEGWHLLSIMINPAINLKCFEGIICGSSARWIIARSFGSLFASAFQSLMEVFFLVAWMLYYFSVKSIDANSRGQTFGRRELEAFLEDDR